jgi:hypothetical protein
MATAPLSAQLSIRGMRGSLKTLDENPHVKAKLEEIATNIRAFLATGDRSRWDPNTPMKPAYELQMAWAIANGRKAYLTCNSTGKLTNVAQIRAYLNGRVAGPPECSGTSAGAGAGASDDQWECVAYMLPTLPPLPSVSPAAPPVPAAPVAEVAPAPRVAALEAEIAALRAENATLKTTLKALL